MKRKHLWLPCGIADEKLDEWPDEDYQALLRATDWQKWITDAQWRSLIEKRQDSNRSKLKRRAAEWLAALARIRDMDEGLFFEAASEADHLRRRLWRIQEKGHAGVTVDIPDLGILGDVAADLFLRYFAKGRHQEGA